MSRVHSFHHIVFATARRQPSLNAKNREALFRFIWSELKNRKCTLIRVNGMSDHIHMLIDLHPSVALADLVRELKSKSSFWLKRCGMFPKFDSWNPEYFAESKGIAEIETVKNYIINQQEHHRARNFLEEIRSLHENAGLEWRSQDYE